MWNLKSIFKLAAAVIVMLLPGCSKNESGRPNIIIVLADDQGWGDMGYNGHPILQTPNFDDMASTGLRFDRFYAAAPVCSPTRGSIMTGRHPNRFGCFSWGHTLRPQEHTIAEALKDAGYVTGHFGKWHLGPVYKGSPLNPGASGFDEWLSAPNFFENNPILSREGTALQTEGESSLVTMDAALRFIEKHKNNPQPFFAYICFGSPHQPHIADERHKSLYPDQEEKFQNFYGEISGMDNAIGKLRSKLAEMDIAENTLLWYLSDNGGLKEVGSAGGREFKGSIYEGGLRVPAIIEWPAVIRKHRTTNLPCNTVDIYPTLLEIAEAETGDLPVTDGISLTPLIKGKSQERTKPIGFWKYPVAGRIVPSHGLMSQLLQKQKSGITEVDNEALQLDADRITNFYKGDTLPGHAAWLDWPYKLHRIADAENRVTTELYDLEKDPYEKNNIASANSHMAEEMSAQLESWMGSVISSLNGDDYKNSNLENISRFFKPPAEYENDFGKFRSPLKFYDGRTVKTPGEWAERRKEILETWHDMMGRWPEIITDQPLEYLDSVRRENFTQYKVRFQWMPGEKTEGYLLVPEGGGKRPAVITVYYEPETAIGQGSPYRDFAYQLARQGFVTLSIGTAEATKERTYSLYYPSLDNAEVQPLSMLGYAAANAWNVLAKVPAVDETRIGITGHSFGGKWSMFASCLYEKFACAVWSDPGIVFDESRPSVNYWEPWYLGYHKKPWRPRGLITADNPAKGLYPELTAKGFDLTDLHALMAPRPFMVSGGSEDPPSRWIALNHSIAVNKLLGFDDRVAMTNRVVHSPDERSNEQIYSFFKHFLNP